MVGEFIFFSINYKSNFLSTIKILISSARLLNYSKQTNLMGSTIEINDTLKISKERGFPGNLTLENHINNPESSRIFLGGSFHFWNEDERLYHHPPARVFLVEEMSDKKWLYWGNALVLEQTIRSGRTEGLYRITKIYQPDFQRQITVEESPSGKSYFDEQPKSFLFKP